MKGQRSVVASVVAVLVAVIALPGYAQETHATICSNLASVSWDVDVETITVAGATVEVLGCDDGERVGLEFITTDGDLPAGGPRGAEVADGRAVFDLTDLEVGVEPVIGVRVYLVVDEDEPPIAFLRVVVEQRLFNAAGNEQVGLRKTTTFIIAPGATYVVPPAPSGYEDVACAAVNTTLPGDLVAESAGRFTAEGSGTHVTCYRQVPGTPGGPGPGGPVVEPPDVLDEAFEREDPARDAAQDADGTDGSEGAVAVREQVERAAPDRIEVLGRTLARTGVDATTLLAVSLLLVAVGSLLLHRRRIRRD